MSKSRLDEYADEIIADYKNGVGPTAMGRRYGISESGVRKWLRKHSDETGYPLMWGGTEHLAKRNKAIVEERLAGASTIELAEKYGLCPQNISWICTRAGVRVDDKIRFAYTNMQSANIIYDYDHCTPIKTIIDRYGISLSAFYALLRRNNVVAGDNFEARNKKIIYDITHGATVKECAEKYNLGRQGVYHVLRKYGVKPKELKKRPTCKIKGISWRASNKLFFGKRGE